MILSRLLKNQLIKDTLGVLKSRVLLTAANLISGAIVARCVGPSGRGVLSLFAAYQGAFSNLFALGLRQSVAREMAQAPEDKQQIFSTLLCLWLAAGLISAILVAVLLAVISPEGVPPALIALAALGVPAGLAEVYAQGVFIGIGKIGMFNKANFVPAVCGLLSAALLVYCFRLELIGVQLGKIAAGIWVLYYLHKWFKPHFNFVFQFSHMVAIKLYKRGILYGIALFLLNLSQRVDVMVLQHGETLQNIGNYGLCVSVAEILNRAASSVGVVIWSQSVRNKDPRANSKLTAMAAGRLLMVLLGVLLFSAIAAPHLIPLVYGKDYSTAAGIFAWMAPGIVAAGVYSVLHAEFTGQGRPLINIAVCGGGLLMSFSLSWLGMRLNGVHGVAMGFSSAQILMLTIMVIVFTRENNLKLTDWAAAFKTKTSNKK